MRSSHWMRCVRRTVLNLSLSDGDVRRGWTMYDKLPFTAAVYYTVYHTEQTAIHGCSMLHSISHRTNCYSRLQYITQYITQDKLPFTAAECYTVYHTEQAAIHGCSILHSISHRTGCHSQLQYITQYITQNRLPFTAAV